MNKYHVLALVSLFLAIIFFAVSVARGEDSVYIFIFIPVFHINSILSGLGALFLFLAFIFTFSALPQALSSLAGTNYRMKCPTDRVKSKKAQVIGHHHKVKD